MGSLNLAALLATVILGFCALAALEFRLRARDPALHRAFLVNLVFFNLLAALGLAAHYVQSGPFSWLASALRLHILAFLLLLLALLKAAWIASYAALVHALLGRSVPPGLRPSFGPLMVLAAFAACAGWGLYFVTADFTAPALTALATDALVFTLFACAALFLARQPGIPSPLRWFAWASLAFVAAAAASVLLAAFWPAWQGAAQSFGNSFVLLLYELFLTLWILRFAPAPAPPPPAALDRAARQWGLTPRETEIVALVCQGRTNQEIAAALFISLQTVKDHNYRIFQKAQVRNRTELARQTLATSPQDVS